MFTYIFTYIYVYIYIYNTLQIINNVITYNKKHKNYYCDHINQRCRNFILRHYKIISNNK